MFPCFSSSRLASKKEILTTNGGHDETQFILLICDALLMLSRRNHMDPPTKWKDLQSCIVQRKEVVRSSPLMSPNVAVWKM